MVVMMVSVKVILMIALIMIYHFHIHNEFRCMKSRQSPDSALSVVQMGTFLFT
jgi:hypothetical protein